MVTPVRKVLDISHWNTVSSWSQVKQAGIKGIIAKATEGTYYKDDTYHRTKEACLEQGLLFGAYHFATNNNVAEQVDYFMAYAGLNDSYLYALDWEDYGDATMSADQARQFLQLMADRVGPFRTVVYAGNTAKENISGVDSFFGSHRLWLAQYGSSPTCQASWASYWLWQYSDGVYGPGPHGCPGVSGDVDTNSFDRSDAELRDEWSGADSTIEPPGPGPGPDPGPEPGKPDAIITIRVQGNATINVVNEVPPTTPPPMQRLSTGRRRRGEHQ